MYRGWRYRVASITGVVLLSAVAVGIANHSAVQSAVATLPLLQRLSVDSPDGPEFAMEVLLTAAVFTGAFFPLYRPRPRRLLGTVTLAHTRVVVAVFAVATIGYFDYTYALSRLTVLLAAPILFVVLPGWFVWIRQRPNDGGDRTIVVGDDPDVIEDVIKEVDNTLLGYLCPTPTLKTRTEDSSQAIADGGVNVSGLDRLGGLSRIEDILVEYDVDTAVLAFAEADRAEFFGTLDACYEHGVGAKVHRDHTSTVLTGGGTAGTLLDVEVEPWDVQDYLLKRGFDIAFSLTGLVVLLPIIAVIATAIKLEDDGPILYRQERTAVFGERFDIFKFRSMVPEGESEMPVNGDKNGRITRVGRVLRRTHLDEIPQLWSILRDDMSVVGPRAVWTEEEYVLQNDSETWRKRWFVKPGLTGLAQIKHADSRNPKEKLHYDLQYVREQSFRYDLKIVTRQLWEVGTDMWYILIRQETS